MVSDEPFVSSIFSRVYYFRNLIRLRGRILLTKDLIIHPQSQKKNLNEEQFLNIFYKITFLIINFLYLNWTRFGSPELTYILLPSDLLKKFDQIKSWFLEKLFFHEKWSKIEKNSFLRKQKLTFNCVLWFKKVLTVKINDAYSTRNLIAIF